MRSAWRATYEKTAYTELPWFEPGPSASVRLAVDERFLRPNSEVLDVGCGAGSNLLFLAERGFRVHGIDLSPGAIAAARARAVQAQVAVDAQEGDALAIPFSEGTLDAVVDIGCFHTLPFSRRDRYAREVHRVVRPGGSFVLSWVAREHSSPQGPPHRPSLAEVTAVFESRFLFERTGFRPTPQEGDPSTYFAFLRRRSAPQPPRR